MFALSGFSWARCGVTICPALLKSLSDGALLAWIAKYLRANWLRRGKSLTWILHHSSRSSSPSMISWEDSLCLAICRSLMGRDLTCFYKLPQNESSFWIAFVYIKYIIACLLFYISTWKSLCYISLCFFYEYAKMV